MPTKVTRFAFCGLRRLNTYRTENQSEDIGMPGALRLKRWGHNCDSINVIVGANGGGKSTVLELIDMFRNPDRLCTLPRENLTTDAQSAYMVDFDSGVRFAGQMWSHDTKSYEYADNAKKQDLDTQSLLLRGYRLNKNGQEVESLRKMSRHISKLQLDDKARRDITEHFAQSDCIVAWWTSQEPLDIKHAAKVLNGERLQLLGVYDGATNHPADPYAEMELGHKARTIAPADECRFNVLLADDTFQHSRVHMNSLPAGWRQLANLLNWLEQQKKGTICLLEEPELHLHPRLQRVLARRMGDLAYTNDLQLFISTHSPVFQDRRTWGKSAEKLAIFEATGNHLDSSVWPDRLLDSLGIRGGDIAQCNGVIWVEGPSDRIYIRHWLNLWRNPSEKDTQHEHVDYAFMFYGGAVLSHYSGDIRGDLVAMLRLNRNAFVIMDCDNDFCHEEGGSTVVLRSNTAKTRIVDEYGGLHDSTASFWITPGYTIESSLPSEFRQQYFRKGKDGKLLPRRGLSKMEIAQKYIDIYGERSSCVEHQQQIETLVRKLQEKIHAWQV